MGQPDYNSICPPTLSRLFLSFFYFFFTFFDADPTHTIPSPILHQNTKYRGRLSAISNTSMQRSIPRACCGQERNKASYTIKTVRSKMLRTVFLKRRRRDLNPRAAINDLLPFQGSPFGQLGYFSMAARSIRTRLLLYNSHGRLSSPIFFFSKLFNTLPGLLLRPGSYSPKFCIFILLTSPVSASNSISQLE